MAELVGVIGLIVTCFGIDLLWQSRREVRFWVATFVGVFRTLLREQQPGALPSPIGAAKNHHAARVALGASLAVAGSLLLALGVTLMILYS
jgi:hypothetical protein